MKNKKIFIIFLLAFLITWISGFIVHPEPGCGDFPDALCGSGWPLMFHRTGGFMGIDQWLWLNMILDYFFWLAVLMGIWFGMKPAKTKRKR